MKKYLTPFELQHRGMDILVRELGYEEAMRFMLQFSRGKGDYTKERRKMLAGLTLAELLESSARSVKAAKAARTRRRSA